MSNYPITLDQGYEYLWQAGQQAVNSGVDPAEVEAFIAELAPLYEKRPRKLEKQPPLIVGVQAQPGDAVSNERGRIELPPGGEFNIWQQVLLAAALIPFPLVSIAVGAAKIAAASNRVTIGLGPQVTIGVGIAASLGAGLCVLPNAGLGYYGSISGMAGIVASISLTAQVTIVGGGLDKFGGWSWGVGIGGGEEIVGNAAALLTMGDSPQFLGITAGIGIGAGIPIEAYMIAQRTWAR